MKTLPFVVKPKRRVLIAQIGNDDIGVLEIERRGYLNVSEKTFVDSIMQGSDAIGGIVALSNRISNKNGKPLDLVYNAVMAAIQGDMTNELVPQIQEEYSNEIGQLLQSMVDSVQKRGLAAATILIQSRIDPEWSVDDTLKQDPLLISEFAKFYDEEDAGYMPDEESKEEKSEGVQDILGKSTEENGEK